MIKYNQIFIVIVFLIIGICIGIIFDFFRIQRKLIKTNTFITSIQDILFWIFSGLLMLYGIIKYTNGELRLYIFINILLGFFLYLCGFSNIIIKIFLTIFSPIVKIISKLQNYFKKIKRK